MENRRFLPETPLHFQRDFTSPIGEGHREDLGYLRTTVQGIYALVKRRKLRPMPGRPGRLLFTRAILDDYLSGKRTK